MTVKALNVTWKCCSVKIQLAENFKGEGDLISCLDRSCKKVAVRTPALKKLGGLNTGAVAGLTIWGCIVYEWLNICQLMVDIWSNGLVMCLTVYF